MQHRTALDENAYRLTNEIWAILDEHLPDEMAKAVKEKVQALQDNALELADVNDKRFYRALMGLIPEHAGEVNAAVAGTLFEGSVCGERELYRWAAGVYWALDPDAALRIVDKLNPDAR